MVTSEFTWHHCYLATTKLYQLVTNRGLSDTVLLTLLTTNYYYFRFRLAVQFFKSSKNECLEVFVAGYMLCYPASKNLLRILIVHYQNIQEICDLSK